MLNNYNSGYSEDFADFYKASKDEVKIYEESLSLIIGNKG